MFDSFAEAEAYLREHDIRMVDLKYCNLSGRLRHVTLAATEFSPDLITSGVGISGPNAGLGEHSGDLVLIPDLSTGFIDPFWDGPVLSFLCNLVDPLDGKPSPYDPRQVARRAEDYLQGSGLASHSLWGPEFEFYVFSGVSFENSANTASYCFESPEAGWLSSPARPGYPLPVNEGYHAIPPGDQLYRLRAAMTARLEELGIPVKYHHHETGGPGQSEIEIPMLPLLKAADATLLIKYVTKMVAQQAGMVVTFLPKPLYGVSGSGMHFHQQLFAGQSNLFYAAGEKHHLSQAARYYIGGLLTHAPAVMALTNPSTNSYRRLVPGFNAPTGRFFSTSQRAAAVRIPAYAQNPADLRFEFRPPDGTCNPYLAIAAMLLAGVDGLKNRIDPSAAGFGPIEEKVLVHPEEVKSLPTSLSNAIDSLENDPGFLVQDTVFDQRLIQEWIRARRQDILSVEARPHPFEVQVYFDI